MASISLVASGLALWLATSAPLGARAADDAGAAAARAAAPFATVGDSVISGAEYQRALALAMRSKYYHAKPPEAELAKFQREVGDDVINRVLLLAEARRRGIEPDRDKIAASVASYDARYQASANWKANREKMLAALLPQLEADSQLERLSGLVRDVAQPAETVARRYYEEHQNLFLEPEQVRLSLILLKVEPELAAGGHGTARTTKRSACTSACARVPISPNWRGCIRVTVPRRTAVRWTTRTAACCRRRCTVWSTN